MAPLTSSWTAREIAQQPELWRRLVEQLDAAPEARSFCDALLRRPEVRIVLTGAGTSAYGGEILAPGLARALRRRVDALPTTDLVSDPHGALAENVPTLLVSFARSGDSPESLAATEVADALLHEVHHLVVTCNPDGALARAHAGRDRSHVVLMPPESEDRGFAMTSSLTCMTLGVLVLLDQADARTVGRLAAVVEDALPCLEGRADRYVADAVGRPERVVHLGSGPLLGLARESALKLLELTAGRVATWGESPMAFRHGPKSVLDESTLAVVHVSTDDHTRAYDLDVLRELVTALPAGRVVAVSAAEVDVDGVETWPFPTLTDLPDALVALAYVVASQVLALRWSDALGLDVDDPFPSKEVNRVVQGVRIHPLG